MDRQTLTGTSIFATNGETDMTFVKGLNEPGEIVIDATGIHTTVFAVGRSKTLAFHSLFFIKQLNHSPCLFLRTPQAPPRRGLRSGIQ